MTKQTHFSRYNKWLVPLFGENYDPRVLYAMFNYLKLNPSKNEKEIREMFTNGIVWNHMIIKKSTIERLYPIFVDELDKEDTIRDYEKKYKTKVVRISESQFKRLFGNIL
jgi:hypothetical protein